MRRLFADRLGAHGERVVLGGEAAHHAKVLRLSAGEAVALFDGEGREVEAIVESVAPLICRIEGAVAQARAAPRATLCLCMPKGGKVDEIVRMATEVGVARIHLAVGERTIARPGEERAAKRIERLRKIAREAARQCGRADVPEIEAPRPLLEVLAASDDRARLLLSPHESVPMPAALHGAEGRATIAIGPEGGFSPAEVEAARRLGYAAVVLGPTVLRVDTAAVVASALVLEALRAADRNES